jgi:hypothetical protein
LRQPAAGELAHVCLLMLRTCPVRPAAFPSGESSFRAATRFHSRALGNRGKSRGECANRGPRPVRGRPAYHNRTVTLRPVWFMSFRAANCGLPQFGEFRKENC